MVLGILLRMMGFLCKLSFCISDDAIFLTPKKNSVASSKHLQTRRFLDTLERYLLDVQKLIIQLHREANERSAPFVDHMGILRDARTGRPINGATSDEIESDGESFDFDEAVMSECLVFHFTCCIDVILICFAPQLVIRSLILVILPSWDGTRRERCRSITLSVSTFL